MNWLLWGGAVFVGALFIILGLVMGMNLDYNLFWKRLIGKPLKFSTSTTSNVDLKKVMRLVSGLNMNEKEFLLASVFFGRAVRINKIVDVDGSQWFFSVDPVSGSDEESLRLDEARVKEPIEYSG